MKLLGEIHWHVLLICIVKGNIVFKGLLHNSSFQACDFSGYFLISGVNFFPKSPFASKEKYLPRKQRKVKTSSFLFVWMWRVSKSSKINHPGGSGRLCPLDQRETQARYPFFRFSYFCQITLWLLQTYFVRLGHIWLLCIKIKLSLSGICRNR